MKCNFNSIQILNYKFSLKLDRVVDRLNPTQVFTKREVVSLLEFSDKELPTIPYDELSTDIEDPVLLSLCKVFFFNCFYVFFSE